MKKTLAIVLAVLMAVATLSGFAFVIGSNEAKADFELLNIYAVDIDLTQAGLRNYEEVVASKDYWTPGKSLAIAVEFRVWNRTLDGHAGAALGTVYTIAVNSTTADMSFSQYAVAKVASYVSINGQKQLSYVAAFPNNTMYYDAASKSTLFNVEIVAQNTAPYLNNVLSSTIIGTVSAKGYVPQPSLNAALLYTGDITVPVLNYGLDPQYVDYTVFLSAKHLAPNAEGVGDLAACFALSWGDDWVYLYDRTGALITANETALDNVLGIVGSSTATVTVSVGALQSYYKDLTTGALGTGTVTTPAAYVGFLNLTAAGYFITRADFVFTPVAAEGYKAPATAGIPLVRYDVFKYTPELRGADMHYVGSYVTEDLLAYPGASAVHFEFDGAVVTLDMTGSYVLSTTPAAADQPITTDLPAFMPTALVWAVAGAKLSYVVPAEAKELVELNKLHADFATGTGQAHGYPIMDSQFTALAAAPKFSTPITNTYLAGQTAAIEFVATEEETESPADEVEGDVVDDVDLPAAGDATIAFVCAAAAILACAALAFVMKKAR